MSIEQLYYFIKVYENKSYTKTSRELFISQPAISTAIRNLEKELKTQLIVVNGKNLELTPSGNYLYSLAKPIVDSYNNIVPQMMDYLYESTTIRIDVPPMLGTFVFAPIFNDFLNKYPKVNIKLFEFGSHANKEALINGKIDIAITVVYKNQIESSLNYKKIGETKLLFAVNKNHPFANKKEISIKDLKDQSIIIFKEDTLQFQILNKLFKEYEIVPKIKLKTEQLSTIKEVLKYGEVGAFLFNQITDNSDDIIGIPIKENIKFDIVIATKKSTKLNDVALDLINDISNLNNLD